MRQEALDELFEKMKDGNEDNGKESVLLPEELEEYAKKGGNRSDHRGVTWEEIKEGFNTRRTLELNRMDDWWDHEMSG